MPALAGRRPLAPATIEMRGRGGQAFDERQENSILGNPTAQSKRVGSSCYRFPIDIRLSETSFFKTRGRTIPAIALSTKRWREGQLPFTIVSLLFPVLRLNSKLAFFEGQQ
jgi:hypothetical protein